MAVRTKRLFGPLAVASAATVVYTCPAGRTAIVKQVDMFNQGGAGAIARMFINGNAAANRVWGDSIPATSSVHLTDWFVVLHPGDTLQMNIAAGTLTVAGYGAELDGVAP